MFDRIEKLIPGQLVEKLLQNENLIGGVLKAVSVSSEIKDLIENQCKQTLHTLSLAPLEEVHSLKGEVERLESDVQVLKDQLIHLAQSSTVELTQAKSDLKTAQATIKELNGKLQGPTSTQKSVPWKASMTKAQLIEIATQAGLSLSGRLTKAKIIEQLTGHTA